MALLAASAGCEGTYDCEEACKLMRDCNYAVGTARETCEVRCIDREESLEDAIDECGRCLDEEVCAQSCKDSCVCALSLDTAEYPGVICTL